MEDIFSLNLFKNCFLSLLIFYAFTKKLRTMNSILRIYVNIKSQ